jgi:hypothetical protein
MSEKLAIDGGSPVLTRADYKNWPVIEPDERRFVKEVLDSGIVAGGSAPQVVMLPDA